MVYLVRILQRRARFSLLLLYVMLLQCFFHLNLMVSIVLCLHRLSLVQPELIRVVKVHLILRWYLASVHSWVERIRILSCEPLLLVQWQRHLQVLLVLEVGLER